MQVEFLARFSKDIDNINQQSVKTAIAKAIIDVEQAKSLLEIRNIKKMQGAKNAYRIRIGDYRIGFFFEHGIVQFARVVHRKDIYRVFP